MPSIPKKPQGRAAQNRILSLEQANRESREKGLAAALDKWLVRFGRRAARDARLGKVQKADTPAKLKQELRDLLLKFGLQQVNDAGARWSKTLGGVWVLPLSAKLDYTKEVENKVRLIVKETEQMIRDSIQREISQAFRETPRPTRAEVARRIATKFHGPPDAREGAFSPGRADRIAQTELGDADTAGAAEGFAVSGVEKVGWLPRPNDGKSGERKHWKMADHKALTIEDIQSSDSSRWFRLPSGARGRRPLDPMLPVGERVNCRCVLIPRR